MVTFPSEKVSEHITKITGPGGEYMYLAEGETRAALIDTGSGIGSLKTCVETLTDKPYIVLLTHGHVDHAMGAPEFDTEVYMNSRDNELCVLHSAMERRMGFIASVSEEIMAQIEPEDYIPARTEEYLPLKHGDSFDLGGLTLEIYECPGHTAGSMVVLFREERTLLLGDACNPLTFLFDEFSSSVGEYRQVLLRLKEQTDGKYDRVYLSHGMCEADPGMIDSVIGVCDDILSGNTDDVPFEFLGEKAYIAKAVNAKMQRADGEPGNIVYRK